MARAMDVAESALKSKLPQDEYNMAGTTAIAALIHPPDGGERKLSVAHVGDARLIKGTRKAEGDGVPWMVSDRTKDHKAADIEEKTRIEKTGARVTSKMLKNGDMLHRVVPPKNADGIGLAIARSLGDGEFKKYGVTAEPTYTPMSLTPEDACIVLASDGLFEFLSDYEVMRICHAYRADATAASRALALHAAKQWYNDSPTYRDDITVCVLYLPLDAPPPADAPPPPPLTVIPPYAAVYTKNCIPWQVNEYDSSDGASGGGTGISGSAPEEEEPPQASNDRLTITMHPDEGDDDEDGAVDPDERLTIQAGRQSLDTGADNNARLTITQGRPSLEVGISAPAAAGMSPRTAERLTQDLLADDRDSQQVEAGETAAPEAAPVLEQTQSQRGFFGFFLSEPSPVPEPPTPEPKKQEAAPRSSLRKSGSSPGKTVLFSS